MLLRYFYDTALAQASYLVGCVATGEALVIDPMREIDQYLKIAQAEGLRITHVTETHIHADFVSGARELATATGAELLLSDMGPAAWKYDFVGTPFTPLQDHQSWMVGNVKVEVLYTPGHTPEHISFMVTDTAGADRPMGIFTGDFVFVGDVGRPDLLESVAGIVGTKVQGAKQQFASIQRIKEFPDYLQLWPAHGAGSACGKALGAVPSTTLGYEKLFNPAFQFTEEQPFVDWLLSGQPEPPRYFAQMKQVNKIGPALSGSLSASKRLSRTNLDAILADGGQVFDLRNRDAYVAGHIAKTLSVPASSQTFSTYIGWFVDFTQPAYFILPDADKLPHYWRDLRAIGVDAIGGYALPDVLTAPLDQLPTITTAELAERRSDVALIDVRGESEYSTKHIVGAVSIPLGYLPRHLAAIPRDIPTVLQCASGYRSHVAASLLRKLGYANVMTLSEGERVWSQLLETAVGV